MSTRDHLRSIAPAMVVMAVLAAGCTKSSDDDADDTAPTSYSATIRRTTDGVPHISSSSIDGVLFGQGWASAQDHGCTLADQVVKVRGERARVFGAGEGDANVASDFSWRAIGIDERARADWPEQSDEVHRYISAFTAGWNKYLESSGPEGMSGWCKGQAWVHELTPEDVYSYTRSVMLRASSGAVTKYLGSAQPPAAPGATTTTPGATTISFGPEPKGDGEIGSNGWSIGAERSSSGGGMLMANPHLPWQGDLRFWEVHLQVPGEMDVYGAQLVGLPFVGVGFNRHVGWTHTDSAGHRFAAYRLTLDPDDPTAYTVDGERRQMTSTAVTIKVRNDDGTERDVTRTLWSSEYGPVLDVPGFGWTATSAVSIRDANLDNTAFFDQYRAMGAAKDMDAFQKAHADHQGVPLFNTIATSDDGRAWYADTAATPALSPEAEAAYRASVAADPIVKTAAANAIILLDGSTSENDWIDVRGARDPGLVAYPDMPKVERRDYVFNANDSFWLPNADHVLEGDYSVMHGNQEVAQTYRTRQNATVLRDTSPAGASGADGKFDADELAAAALANGVYSERLLRPTLVDACAGATSVTVPALAGATGAEIFARQQVDVREACRVIAAWDGTLERASKGAALFRELFDALPAPAPSEPFDPARPVDTPNALPEGAPGRSTVLEALGRAVEVLRKAGLPLDAPMAVAQHDGRLPQGDARRVFFGGGVGRLGVTNVIGYNATASSTLEPVPRRPEPITPKSALTSDGYWVNSGSSFMMVLEFTDDGPRARTILTYGETGDPASELFTSQTTRFSDENWKPVVLSDDDIEQDQIGTTVEISS